MCHPCGIMIPKTGHAMQDEQGCVLKQGHDGPHQFFNEYNEKVFWETDWECNCENCLDEDCSDFCFIYSVNTSFSS